MRLVWTMLGMVCLVPSVAGQESSALPSDGVPPLDPGLLAAEPMGPALEPLAGILPTDESPGGIEVPLPIDAAKEAEAPPTDPVTPPEAPVGSTVRPEPVPDAETPVAPPSAPATPDPSVVEVASPLPTTAATPPANVLQPAPLAGSVGGSWQGVAFDPTGATAPASTGPFVPAWYASYAEQHDLEALAPHVTDPARQEEAPRPAPTPALPVAPVAVAYVAAQPAPSPSPAPLVATASWPATPATQTEEAAGAVAFQPMAVVAAVGAWALVRWTAGTFLLSRIRREDLLQQGTRARIHDFIASHPGAHLSEIRRELGLSRGPTSYHLQVLVAAGLVVKVQMPAYCSYFANGASAGVRSAARALRVPNARNLLDHILQNPGVATQDLVARADMARSMVYHHLNRLVEVGLVEFQGGARNRTLHPTQLALQFTPPSPGVTSGGPPALAV